MQLLDTKDESVIEILLKAPKIIDHLSTESLD